MRIDFDAYREKTCKKCSKFSETVTFGKCIGVKTDIYECARKKLYRMFEEILREDEK